MAYATQTIEGRVGDVYELRRVGERNTAVVDASIGVTDRKKVDGEWVDGETNWVRVKFWNRLAENISESWAKGDLVFVHGRVSMNDPYENKNGETVPARQILVADLAGHSNSIYKTSQTRERNGAASTASGGQGSRRSEESAPRQQPQRQAAPQQAAPKPSNDIFDDGFGLDMGGSDGDDLPF